jgi:hypothetical protein
MVMPVQLDAGSVLGTVVTSLAVTGNVSHTKVEEMLIMKRTLWEKFLNFVTDVPMKHVNFTVIVITARKNF